MRANLLILALFLFAGLQVTQAQVSKGVYQTIETADADFESIHIQLSTPNIQVKRTNGTKLKVSGKVKLSIANAYFLDHLVDRGRYILEVTPTTDGGVILADKARTPIILRGEACAEEVYFTLHIPKSVKSVVFENTTTGDSNVIVMQ